MRAAARALAPGFEPGALESLEELEVGVAWLDRADPLVRERVAEAASLFPRRREIELPLAPANRADFMREVADVHRALFPGNEELYGENVRGKIERCLRVTDAEAAAAERERAEYRERFLEAAGGLDLVVTPTVLLVAPPADADELALRLPATDHTYPFSSLGWPALALPCGPAEDGLPASVQLAAPRGEDARVLAAGRLLESLLPAARRDPAFLVTDCYLGGARSRRRGGGWSEVVEEDRVRRPDSKGHVQRDGRDGPSALPAEAASPVDEKPHLLVTRSVEPHLGGCASDRAIHFGDRNGSLRLPLDLVEEPEWDARGEREHAARLAWQASRILHVFVPERHERTK